MNKYRQSCYAFDSIKNRSEQNLKQKVEKIAIARRKTYYLYFDNRDQIKKSGYETIFEKKSLKKQFQNLC